ncbi:hypothetical protein AJ78_06844 [Emergomyces pasteurianus Ep9510]|uniref:MalT-like TPR region domain-containing protein n=1 Tax=Emergomyces pasteurianus Ep9510 TaxID=1447872 RepID=A0A1J9Q8S9_9EURO|nr:hypothetical protein AJ78_06844 [Emergomyces pasteurianus Ep9510]
MCSLINYEEGDRSFHLHPLVDTLARDRIHPNQRKLWAHIALNTLMESITLPSDKDREMNTGPLREIIPHLDECYAASPVKVELFSSRRGRLGVLGANLTLPTMSYVLRGQALTAAKRGYLYAQSGRFSQSAHLLSMVKDLTVQTLGYNNETTQKAMLFLADVLWDLGQLKSCITIQNQTVLDMAKLGHSFWLNGQSSWSTLGSWQRYEQSKALHERVLNAGKQILGEAHPETLTTMSNLAMALLDLEQKEQARQMIHHVYKTRKQNLELGGLEEGENMLVGGIAAGKRSLGDEHLGVLMGCGGLARIYTRQGRLDEAEELTRGTLQRVKESRGSEHYDYIYGMRTQNHG